MIDILLQTSELSSVQVRLAPLSQLDSVVHGWAIVLAPGPLWEGRDQRMAITSGNRNKPASALTFVVLTWRIF